MTAVPGRPTDEPLTDGVVDQDPHAALASELRKTRLDLLPVLYELLRTGSVTKTARNLGLTQSAVSQSLKSLRATFGDELLVPLGRALQPTELARSLIVPLESLLEDAHQILSPRKSFDPASEALHVVISTSDYVSMLLAPRLVAACASAAPRVTIEFAEHSTGVAIEELGTIDFFIAPRAYDGALGKRVGSMHMWDDDIVCIAATANAAVGDVVGVEDLATLRQASYRVHSSIQAKQRRLLQPQSLIDVPHVCVAPDFSVLSAVVERSDAVAFVPRRMASLMEASHTLRTCEIAPRNKDFAIDAYWSAASVGRRGHAWFRDLLRSTAQAVRDETR